MKRLILGMAFVIVCLFVQAQIVRRTVNSSSSLNMGVKVKNIGMKSQPAKMMNSRAVIPARVSSAVAVGPGVSYTVPEGTLFQGSSNDFYGYPSTFAYASPFTNWTFTNLTATTPSFLWTVSKYQGADSTATSVNLNMRVTTASYNMPTLKGSANGVDSTFIFGKSFESKADPAYIDAGGSVYTDASNTSYNWTNCLPDLSQVTYTFGTNDYAFGTGTSGIDALVSLYDKPQSTLYFEGANFFLGAFSAPANTTFTLRVITVNIDANGKITPKDTLATSQATTADVIVSDPTAQVLPFTSLVSLDKDGFETAVPYLELNEPFFLELSGFNVPGVTLGMRSSYYDSEGTYTLPYTSNHAYFYIKDAQNVRSLAAYTWPATLVTTLTNAAYGYLLSNTNSIVANINGGSANVTLTPMFDSVWVAGVLPSWIAFTQTEHYVTANWGTDAKLTYQPLPAGVAGRSADIVFKTWGAQVTVRVSQGTVAGIASVNITKSKVYSTDNSFELSYPNEFNEVTLISLSGQVMGNYALPASGKFSIPEAGISKGIYFFKFAGKETETVKVIR